MGALTLSEMSQSLMILKESAWQNGGVERQGQLGRHGEAGGLVWGNVRGKILGAWVLEESAKSLEIYHNNKWKNPRKWVGVRVKKRKTQVKKANPNRQIKSSSGVKMSKRTG